MAERRQRPPLQDADGAGCLGPAHVAVPGKFRAPAQPAGQRHQPFFDRAAQALLGAKAAGEDDFSARPHDTREFVQRPLRVRDGGDDVLRHDNIE